LYKYDVEKAQKIPDFLPYHTQHPKDRYVVEKAKIFNFLLIHIYLYKSFKYILV